MTEQHADNLIDAYALGALEPDEVAWVESHLEVCHACQQLARVARAQAAALLYDMPLVEPPAELRHHVLDRVRQEMRHATGDRHAGTAAAQAPGETSEQSTASSSSAIPGGRRPRGLHRLLRGLLGEEPRAGSDAGSDAVAARLMEFLSAPDCQLWDIAGTADAPGASARLVGVPNGHDAVLLASGLHALPADRAYQVWFLRGGQPTPNAVFSVTHAGHGRQVVHAPGRLSEFEVVAVTPEPASGSPAPTGPIVLAGELAH